MINTLARFNRLLTLQFRFCCQVVLWDLALERDAEGAADDDKLKDLPPQLLFIHQEIQACELAKLDFYSIEFSRFFAVNRPFCMLSA